MQLLIRGQTLLTLELSGSETLAQIKERVAELSGIPPEDQVLLHAGTPLDDEAVLGQSPLPEFATLDLSTRLLGGNSGGA
ncbi:UBIM protein, partial [Certhia brachydactyla]|nr:UBIM protein [Certhia brachydactyla]